MISDVKKKPLIKLASAFVRVYFCTTTNPDIHLCVSPLSHISCSVFEVLRSEARVMEGLRSLLIDTPYIHDILKLNVQPSESDYAVDIRNPAISVRYRT